MAKNIGRPGLTPVPGVTGGSSFRATLSAAADALPPARRAMRAWLVAAEVDQEDVDAVLISCGEACANALEHGLRLSGPGTVEVRADITDRVLEAWVIDQGAWRDPVPTNGHRGRGMTLMRVLMDEVEVRGTPSGTTVHLRKHLRALNPVLPPPCRVT